MFKKAMFYSMVAALALPGIARADEDPDPMDILKKADKATKKVKAVRYKAVNVGEGAAAERRPKVEGELVGKRVTKKKGLMDMFTGGGNVAPHMRSIKGTAEMPEEDSKRSFQVATDLKKVYSINEKDKTFTVGEAGEADMLMSMGNLLLMVEYFHDNPFGDEIDADEQKYEGSKTIGGVDCDVVYVEYAGGRGKSRWYFGKEDHLPRRVDRLAGQGDYHLEITDLQVDPDIDDEVFTPEKPAGYEEKKYKPQIAKAAVARPELLKVGEKAPDWTLETPDGKKVSLKDLRGNLVLMDFWATWCGPCKMAMPGVQKLHEEFGDKSVKVLGVNCWERGGDPAKYMKDQEFTYGLLLKADDVAKQYKVSGIPTFYLIDQEGKILYAASGFGPDKEAELKKLIKKNLKPRDL